MEKQLSDLSENVQKILTEFVESSREACGSSLVSVVLFGSAAEGRLRTSSDVNLILVLKKFETSEVDQLRESLRRAHAAIQLNVMFLLESEIEAASEAFAVKFADILHRHRILFGTNPFQNLKVSRAATLQRLKQVVVNLILRLRERYVLVSLREDQLATIIADAAGPMRTSAATLLALQGQGEFHPKEALQKYAHALSPTQWNEVLRNMSQAREELNLRPGVATKTLQDMIQLLQIMHEQIQQLK